MQKYDLPYYSINSFYKSYFQEKVYKIPVSFAETCPNREGIKGMEACIFCDEWGSAAYPENRQDSLKEQIEKNKEVVKKRSKASKFLVYFQSYTNTFLKTLKLRSAFEEALSFKDVCGLVVGTRPDCLSQTTLNLWKEFHQRTNLFIEIGVQSFNDESLVWMKRGHDSLCSIKGIEKIKKTIPNLNIGIHLIFGMPNEKDKDIIEAAKITSSLPIHNVKLHNMHILKNTPLELQYKKGLYTPLTFEEYAHRVGLFLQHLSPHIAVHRLAANASRTEELIAPEWVSYKMKTYQELLDFLQERGIYQSQLCY